MSHGKLPTDPYKGVRDFYPEDQFLQRYLFEHMSRMCELFGYEEFHASVLEPTDLYRAKTSEEIIREQSYTFTDRGDREVTLRPEMTPTLARMVAAKHRELALPVRWYTVANCFRYERTQKGRLREFWQLNADIVGAAGIEADAEVIALSHAIMRALGADERNFEIRVSDRRMLDAAYDAVGIAADKRAETTRLLDRREKLDDFEDQLTNLIGGNEAQALIDHLDKTVSTAYLEELRGMLSKMGIGNMIVDTKITRGFDYYTGMVFEVFDTSGENRRSMFGGGRYDNLTSLFGEAIPAVGFAMGDVTARDFLQTHNLTPTYQPTTELMICVVDASAMGHATKLAMDLRSEDVAVAVNFSGKRLGDQIRQADKLKIPYILAVGEKERDTGTYVLKNLATGHETPATADRIAEHLFSSLG